MIIHTSRRSGFTVVELLVAIAIIIILLGLLLPALGGVWSAGNMTKSMNNMRQIAAWMSEYSSDNDDFVVPSRFDYGEGSDAIYKGQVRSNPDPALGMPNTGTWSDILHSVFEVGVWPDAGVPEAGGGLGNDYRHDSPDRALYDLLGKSAVNSPFRSAAPNSRGVPNPMPPDEPTPFGTGAKEPGEPGYFAANDFFMAGWPTDPDEGQFFTNGQIRAPARSLYLVDSFFGEVIADAPEPFDNTGSDPTIEVDFRYGGRGEGACLILYLDGHTAPETPWQDLDELQGLKNLVPGEEQRRNRQIRIENLTGR